MWALLGVLLAQAARAQTPYVGAAVGADVLRSTSATFLLSSDGTSSGEAWHAAIRAGTFLARRFGLELELSRPAAILLDDDLVYVATRTSLPALGGDPNTSNTTTPGVSIFPPPIISQETRLRTTTLSTLVFARQSIGARADLVYLGGLGFSRVLQEIEYGTPGQPIGSRSIEYGVGPVVGAEARIGMTAHARLVAGIRLHSLGQTIVDGWILRPAVGLSWSF